MKIFKYKLFSHLGEEKLPGDNAGVIGVSVPLPDLMLRIGRAHDDIAAGARHCGPILHTLEQLITQPANLRQALDPVFELVLHELAIVLFQVVSEQSAESEKKLCLDFGC